MEYGVLCLLTVFILLAPIAKSSDLSSASYDFYFGQNQWKSYELGHLQDILQASEFDANKTTTLYIHGYSEKQDDESLQLMISSYLLRKDQNLVAMNWTELSRGNYLFESIPNLYWLCPVVASNIIKLFDEGVEVNKFHIVAHSLGGQLAGCIGRNIKKESKKKIILRRISALDPAFPGFYPGLAFTPLSASDAKFVDVIHTDAGIYGAPVPTGTADFWPNGGGSLQPGCPKRNFQILTNNDLCSHRRSWRFWAESVANKYPKKFNAVRKRSSFSSKFGLWRKFDSNVVMGIDCPENLRGQYYLTTNSEEPFAKGEAGTVII